MTLENVRTFRQSLDDLRSQCDNLLAYKERKQMFRTADDVKANSVNRLHVPSDYYYFRLFDHYIELCKDKKGYYIYAEHYVPSDPNLQKLRTVSSRSQYRIDSQRFDDIINVFELFCVDMIHSYFKHDSHLIYMY